MCFPWYEHIDRLNLFIVMILSFDKKKQHGVYSFFTHWHRDVIYEGWLVNVWNRDLQGKSIYGYNMNLVRETKNYVGNKRKIHEPERA